MNSEDLLTRINQVEDYLGTLTHEVRFLRSEVEAQRRTAAAAVTPAVTPAVAPAQVWAPRVWEAVTPPAAAPPSPVQPAQPHIPRPQPEPARVPVPEVPRGPGLLARSARWLADRELSDLLGARVLAWTGGAVTLLGIAFFFVLAVNRGLIGPEVRVACGAVASALVFGAGIWLHARQRESYAGLAAVGTGIAGSYATVLAAAGLYDLIPDAVALSIAAVIAGSGVWMSLAWSAQPVAGLGLVGAMAVPPMLAFGEGGPSLLGTWFVVLVLAASCTVAVVRQWPVLLRAALVVSLPQIALLVAQASAGSGAQLLAVATVAWLVCLATAIAWQRSQAADRLQTLTATLALAGLGLAYGAAERLYDGPAQGWILLANASVFAALGAALLLRRSDRDLSSLLWAGGAALAALGLADVLTGPSLALAWSVQAALLAWLCTRVGERRFLVLSAGYLVLAFGHVLLVDAPPSRLFVVGSSPGAGVAPLLFAAAAALAFVACAGSLEVGGQVEPGSAYERLEQRLDLALPAARAVAVWAAGWAILYAACLAVLALSAGWSSDEQVAFDRGQVAVSVLLAGVALAAFAAGTARGDRQLGVGALVVLAAAAAKVGLFDRVELPDQLLAVSLFAVCVSAALAGLLQQRSVEPREIADELAFLLVLVSAAAGVPAAFLAASGTWHGLDSTGLWLLALGAGYGLLAGFAFSRERDLFTLLGALSLTLTAAAATILLDGTWLVLALAVSTAGLALLAGRTREPRLLLASGGYLGFALAHTLIVEAPATDLFTVQPKPASGVPALLLVAVAALVLAVKARHVTGDRPASFARQLPVARAVLCWLTAVVVGYAASLALLGLAQAGSGGSPETRFLHGQVAVNSLWAVVAIAWLLASALGFPSLRVGGWILIGCTVAKVMLFDYLLGDGATPYQSIAIVGCALALMGFADQVLGEEPARLRWPPAGAVVSGATLMSGGMLALVNRPVLGVDPDAVALLAPATLLGVLAVAAFGVSRDLSTLLWAISIGLAAVCAPQALDGVWVVGAWSALAVVLVTVAERSREPRLLTASAVLVGLALGHTLVLDTPLTELFVASRHPGHGVAGLLFTMAAGFVLVRAVHRQPAESLPGALESRRARSWALATIALGVGGLYAVSLVTLEVSQAIGTEGVAAGFQRGHTAVSALWGVAGLTMLYLGLRRRRPGLRIAGLATFAVSLLKLFVYDLTFLSSITRALSFLAVGCLLLVGGFLYQRLSAQTKAA